MSEEEWTLEQEEAPKKRRVPRWALFSCAGCSLLIVLVVVAGIAAVSMLKMDEGEGLARLDELMPFEELPDSLDYQLGMDMKVFEQIVLVDTTENFMMNVMIFDMDEGGEAITQFMGEGGAGQFAMPVDPVFSELDLQGRAAPIVRYTNIRGGETLNKWTGEQATGPGVRLDLRAEGRNLVIEVRRFDDAELTDDELLNMFEPFDVWP